MKSWHDIAVELRAFYHDSTLTQGATAQLAYLISREIQVHPRSCYNDVVAIEHKLQAMCGAHWKAHPEYEPQYAMGQVMIKLRTHMEYKLAAARGRSLAVANKAVKNG